MNFGIFTGYLARDPRSSQTNSGTSVCSFTIPITEKIKGEKKTMWVDVSCFGKQADTASQYLHKGSGVCVRGKVGFRTYDKDGQTNVMLTLLCDSFEFLSSGNGGGERQQSANDQMGNAPW